MKNSTLDTINDSNHKSVVYSMSAATPDDPHADNHADDHGDEFDEMLDDETPVEVDLHMVPTFTFKTGVNVVLQPVAPMAVEYLQSNEVGKPEAPKLYNGKYRPPVPEKIRTRADGEDELYLDYSDPTWKAAYESWLAERKHRIKMRLEQVLDHPDYMRDLEDWQASKQRRLVRYLAIKGVKTMPPDEYAEEAMTYMPSGATLNDLKYMWIMENLPSEQAISDFYEAIAGLTMPTEDGVAEVKKN